MPDIKLLKDHKVTGTKRMNEKGSVITVTKEYADKLTKEGIGEVIDYKVKPKQNNNGNANNTINS